MKQKERQIQFGVETADGLQTCEIINKNETI
jgi:hypothetical protein